VLVYLPVNSSLEAISILDKKINNLTQIKLKAPYVIFIGEVDNASYAKTGLGIIQWRPELVAGQLRFEGNTLDLGVPDMTVQQAVAAGVKSIIIGVAGKIGLIDLIAKGYGTLTWVFILVFIVPLIMVGIAKIYKGNTGANIQ